MSEKCYQLINLNEEDLHGIVHIMIRGSITGQSITVPKNLDCHVTLVDCNPIEEGAITRSVACIQCQINRYLTPHYKYKINMFNH